MNYFQVNELHLVCSATPTSQHPNIEDWWMYSSTCVCKHYLILIKKVKLKVNLSGGLGGSLGQGKRKRSEWLWKTVCYWGLMGSRSMGHIRHCGLCGWKNMHNDRDACALVWYVRSNCSSGDILMHDVIRLLAREQALHRVGYYMWTVMQSPFPIPIHQLREYHMDVKVAHPENLTKIYCVGF